MGGQLKTCFYMPWLIKLAGADVAITILGACLCTAPDEELAGNRLSPIRSGLARSLNMTDDAFSLEKTFVHVGLGAVAIPLHDFAWDEQYLAGYSLRFAADGEGGRLVCVTSETKTWSDWERHPAGDELVVLLSGRVDVVREVTDGLVRVQLTPGQAAINPRGVWHTSDVLEPGKLCS
jgi:mannose-6-phosphate isomerase-like protein (cupin superfamily)